MPNPFAASVAIIRQIDVLLIQRNRPPSEGLWTLPGGRLEPGETAERCAIRELKEELGLDVFGLRKVRTLRVRGFELQVFGTQTYDGQIVPDTTEIRAWRWVRPEQLRGMPTTPGLGEVLAGAFRLFDRT